ncbi:hypothetical protein CRV24_008479 [Beauveria bassiana]|nr:hypothetical protein CRV24_008479 [Beauveria bassiana]
MYGPRRIIRGSACQACHRLKARCLRQPGLNPCARCERNGRECLALDLTGSAVSRSRGPRRVRSITHPELSSDSDGTTDLVELARPILPSIYSISPVDTITGRLELGDNSSYTLSQASASNAAEVYAFSHGISAEYASQLIDLYHLQSLYL